MLSSSAAGLEGRVLVAVGSGPVRDSSSLPGNRDTAPPEASGPAGDDSAVPAGLLTMAGSFGEAANSSRGPWKFLSASLLSAVGLFRGVPGALFSSGGVAKTGSPGSSSWLASEDRAACTGVVGGVRRPSSPSDVEDWLSLLSIFSGSFPSRQGDSP